MKMKIENATILDYKLMIHRGCLVFDLVCQMAIGVQSFGGINLYNKYSKDVAGEYIRKVLDVVGVENACDLISKNIRVFIVDGEIIAIANILKEDWFDLEKFVSEKEK